jgi:hypothetical protein
MIKSRRGEMGRKCSTNEAKRNAYTTTYIDGKTRRKEGTRKTKT